MKTATKSNPPKTADTSLPSHLTQQFISDLSAVLRDDHSEKARVLSAHFMSKFADPAPGRAEERRSAAIRKWMAVEAVNGETNRRLSNWVDSQSVEILPGVSCSRFFARVRLVVSSILPWEPSLNLFNNGFSGGASTSKGRRQGHPALKFLDRADITRDAYPLFEAVNRKTRWADHLDESRLDPRFVRGNVMFTVPKSSDIDRCACKEPDLNMFLQKGFGNQIRSLLKRVGVDLNDQRHNQELARLGSIDGSLATLDLSSASDSVTYELVRACLPPNWFYYLDLVRSKVMEVDGVEIVPQMFSSMGNGFTFELESLLFYAIARATAYFGGVSGRISVYGDDIIVPTEISGDVVSALLFCGFRVNPDKSFVDGPFRESCGAYWHGGENVKPFFIRRPFSTISDLILTLNQLVEWSSREIGVVDPRYEDLLLRYFQHIPQSLWGGSDMTSRTSLVTGDEPRSELVYPTQERTPHHVGGLLLWLFSASERTSAGCLSVSLSSMPGWARIKRRARFKTATHFVDGQLRSFRTDVEPIEHDVPVFLKRYGVI